MVWGEAKDLRRLISTSRRLRPIPPFRQALIRDAGLVSIMRDVVEEHEPGPREIPEVDDGQARRRLVKAIAIATRIEGEEATQHQSGGWLCGRRQAAARRDAQ